MYCWMCTAASPASSTAPSAKAAELAVSRPAVVQVGRVRVLVATDAPAPARGPAGDLGSAGGQREPLGAEGGRSLSVSVPGLLVVHVEVERVPVVGDLRLAVRSSGGSDQRPFRPAADRRLAARPQRRPRHCARARARA